jgi:uncharacterized protein DUF1488
MSLNFPNPTRSFDEMRKAVRFVGHDGVFEIKFFVEGGALADEKAQGREAFEARCLSAFDENRDSIQSAARVAYSHRRLNAYTLSAADFAHRR